MELITYKPYSNAKKTINHPGWFVRNKKRLILEQTPAELMFYDLIRRYGFKGKVMAQKTIRALGYHFYLDFYIPSKKIAVEFDGEYHDNSDQEERDAERAYLIYSVKRIEIIRFRNEDILNDPITFIENFAEKYLYANKTLNFNRG